MSKKISVWTQGPMTRIFPHDQAPRQPMREITISAARGECECFQVGLRMDGVDVREIIAEASDLKGSKGATIRARNVTLLYPEFVPVKLLARSQSAQMIERKPPAFFPDPLLPAYTYDTSSDAVCPPARSVWVRVRVPQRAAPGVYRGTIRVVVQHRCGELSRRLRFRLRVWDFVLPKRSRLLMTNWLMHKHLAEWYETEMWSADYWKLLERVATDMAEHRQNVILTPYFGGQWLEMPTTAHEQLIGVEQRGRTYTFNFRRLDRWIRLFFDHGFALIEGQHVASECREPFRMWVTRPGKKPKPLIFKDVTDPRFEGFLAQFIRALWAHLEKRGWQNRYVQHISDEPSGEEPFRRYKRLAEIVREAAPGIKIIDAIGDPAFGELIDHPVPLESCYEEVRANSGRPVSDIWTYYCCAPTGDWPNRFLEYRLIRVRIFSWLCFQRGIPGFLHWGYNFWGSSSLNRKGRHNPWDDTTANRWPGGDPCVIYPPYDNHTTREQIIGSIRWEIIREAMEDYEYLSMTRELAEAGNSEASKILEEVATKVVPDWTSHTRDWVYLDTVRERMGNLLSKTRSELVK